MEAFRKFLEVAEIQKPKGKITRKNPVKDAGTNVAKRVIEYNWTTELGNKILLRFEPKGDDYYSVIFYTNGVLFDRASISPNLRDPQILANVFYVLKDKADKIKAKGLQFHSYETERDTKTFFKLDIEKSKQAFEKELSVFHNQIKSQEVKEIPPTANQIDLYKRINKPLPTFYNFKANAWLEWIDKVKNQTNIYPLEEALNELKNSQFPFSVTELADSMKKYINALISHTPSGYSEKRNRRTSVYQTILTRYFSKDWDIKVSGNNFTLTRKSE